MTKLLETRRRPDADPATASVLSSRETLVALRRAGQTGEYHAYNGEGHRFDDAWRLFAKRRGDFFGAHV